MKDIVIITTDLDYWKKLFCQYGGWEIVSEGYVSSSLSKIYFSETPIKGSECVLRFPHSDVGRIRFIKWELPCRQDYKRPAGKIWDTGGIADFDLRVHDIYKTYFDLQEWGWRPAYLPNRMPAPPFELDEMLMSGPDGVMIAFIQRYQPPLELPEGYLFPSQAYLSAMIVKDYVTAYDFFINRLQFVTVTELNISFQDDVPNNFGIPRNFSQCIQGRLCMFSPDGGKESMMEIIHWPQLRGEDYSANTHPSLRGIFSYRIELKNLTEYFTKISDNNVKWHVPVKKTEIDGRFCLYCSIFSPDGALLEFFEFEE
ncbi:MAG: hypothetical protein N2747_00995 [Chitinophagaceae bacterium]|nr:hypothetical protein [Chitinophagaceae bacterium]